MYNTIFKNTYMNISAKSLLNKHYKNKIFFLHVPKTGGTSVDHAIKENYKKIFHAKKYYIRHDSLSANIASHIINNYDIDNGSNSDIEINKFGVMNSAYLMAKKNNNYISGHMCFDKKVHEYYKNKYDYITVLRDPVKRFISFFFYMKYRDVKNYDFVRLKFNFSLDEYLQSYYAKTQGYEYIKYYGGLLDDDCYNNDESVSRALENLKKFKIIGFTDDLNAFSKEFFKHYNISLNIKHMKKNPASSNQKNLEISDDLLKEIGSICKFDIDLYKSIREIMQSNKY